MIIYRFRKGVKIDKSKCMFVYLLKGKICGILAKKIFCGQIYSKVLYFLL